MYYEQIKAEVVIYFSVDESFDDDNMCMQVWETEKETSKPVLLLQSPIYPGERTFLTSGDLRFVIKKIK